MPQIVDDWIRFDTAMFMQQVVSHPDVQKLDVVQDKRLGESWIRQNLIVEPDDTKPFIWHIELSGADSRATTEELLTIVGAAVEVAGNNAKSYNHHLAVLQFPICN